MERPVTKRSGGRIRLSPTDPRFRRSLTIIARNLDMREQLLCIGFHNRPCLLMTGGLATDEFAEVYHRLNQYICWKAVMYVGLKNKDMARATVLELGSGDLYGLRINKQADTVKWAKPDVFAAQYLRRFRNW